MANQIINVNRVKAIDLANGTEILNVGIASQVVHKSSTTVVFVTSCISRITKVVEYPHDAELVTATAQL